MAQEVAPEAQPPEASVTEAEASSVSERAITLEDLFTGIPEPLQKALPLCPGTSSCTVPQLPAPSTGCTKVGQCCVCPCGCRDACSANLTCDCLVCAEP
jgi:hypothetical protein